MRGEGVSRVDPTMERCGETRMRVLFYVGYPLAWAKGGHALQILESKRALEQLGCEVRWLHHEDPELPGADILHYWTRPPNDVHWQLARQHGLRLVISELHQAAVLRPRWSWPLRRWLARGVQVALGSQLFGLFGAGVYRECDAAIAVTAAEADYMRVVFGARADKVHCIPNAADDVFFDEAIAPETVAGLVCIGYICKRKNSIAVAKAAAEAGVPITFVGGAPFGEADPYVAEFKARVDNKHVFWLGEVTDRRRLAAIIRGSRGLVLASQNEGLPLSILEALACGKPVLCSDLSNLRAHYGDAIHYCHQPGQPEFRDELREFDQRCGDGLGGEFKVARWQDVGGAILDVYVNVLREASPATLKPACGALA